MTDGAERIPALGGTRLIPAPDPIAAEYLLKIIFTHVAVPFQVLHDEFDFFAGRCYLLWRTTEF